MTQQNSLEAQILARAAKDPAFRQQLLRDPKGTIAKEFGVAIPANVTLQVHEETETVRHLILPKVVQPQAVVLDDNALESAVGGMRMRDADCCCTCGSSSHQTLYDSYGPR